MQKLNQKKFRVEKVIKRKGDKLNVKWKIYDSSFNNWIDKRYIIWMSEYFPKPKSLWWRIKIELDLPNYATKADLTNTTDISNFAKVVDLANIKPSLDQLDIDKFKNVPTNLKNLASKVDKLHVFILIPAPADLS